MNRVKQVTPLKLAIVATGRPQREIAAEVGMSESHFSRVVNGLHVDDATAAKIAKACERTADELFGASGAQRAA